MATRVVAIGRGLPSATLVEVADALADGGVRAFELTLNSEGALEGIAELTRRLSPDRLLIGAGTVLAVEDAQRALDAGATFLVMPHLDTALVEWAAERGVPVFPGAFSPTEILAAWRAGAAAVKLFPASAATPSFVREFRGPFPRIPLVPTGGVTVENAPLFVTAGAVAVGLGSWLTGSGAPATVAARAKQVVAAVAPDAQAEVAAAR
jgi:2-dehydro-3-deoxyphosphogluconate aldolase/(4S)-4-hydroxy-2-oxoglutarate aldolase